MRTGTLEMFGEFEIIIQNQVLVLYSLLRTRLAYDPLDKSTWKIERIHMPWHQREDAKTFAPKVGYRSS